MNEQFRNILLTFKKEQDLNNKVLKVFAPSLIKLDKIAQRVEKQQISFEDNVKFNQIINTDLPKLLQSYTSLPIDIRNNTIINNYDSLSNTAFDIFMQSISMIANKINFLWDNILESDTDKLLIRKKTLEYTSNHNGANLEVEKEKEDYSINIDKEIARLIKKAEGNWQNGFHNQLIKKTNEIKKEKKGLSPVKFFILFSSVFIILLSLLSLFKL